MRKVGLILCLLIGSLTFVPMATATQPTAVTLKTTKQVHSATGTWSASGAISDSGTLRTLHLDESALPAPAFVVTHVMYEFESPLGTFTLEAQIKETLTGEPGVLAGEGRWVIRHGTGAYATLHGQGEVVGVVDHKNNIVKRTYGGDAHFD